MRKQYHSRQTKRGRLIWDVDRLVELSKDLPCIEVSLDSFLELDESYWFEGKPAPTVRDIVVHVKLVHECDLSYPIILSSDGRVMDGMHRIVKALSLGHDYIDAVKFETDPEPDHIDVSLDDLPY